VPVRPDLASTTLCLLTGYFAIAAQYLDGEASAPADHALVTLLRVLAGACAIAALVFGLALLNVRDAEIMRAQRAARDASIGRASGPGE
jgi:hypothetical protein